MHMGAAHPWLQDPTPEQLKAQSMSASRVSHASPLYPEWQSHWPHDLHSPRPEHIMGHVRNSQPAPVKPSVQRHEPATQWPPFAQSGSHCVRSHAAPVHPASHLQIPLVPPVAVSHVP